MELNTPIISTEMLTDKELNIYKGLDNRPYGELLARKVTRKLMNNPVKSNGGYYSGNGLHFAHRDYCGIGLYFFEEKFVLGEVNDGMGPYPILVTFDNEAAFVMWLANQSNQSMSLIAGDKYPSSKFNNQTITRLRLEWYIEDHYDAGWNAYCTYVRKREETQTKP
ncbi:hypothetical protein [Olivibacter domesticus]|uniref:Uncharacterized protein n=1 Tax=Olivibacter domesticus TaxID=407022 RepID=A0A1H7ZEN8_OLID1|nr:hypothetical protein [Olivibacter domesticus]SEM56860.1 hypothetical protein SAMN05661044_05523 [Olivibacter domesticus]